MNHINYRKYVKSILHNPLDNLVILIDTHSDHSLISVTGKIISETKFMINLLSHKRGLISIPKQGGKFVLTADKIKISIEGQLLVGTPKSRSKKKFRDW